MNIYIFQLSKGSSLQIICELDDINGFLLGIKVSVRDRMHHGLIAMAYSSFIYFDEEWKPYIIPESSPCRSLPKLTDLVNQGDGYSTEAETLWNVLYDYGFEYQEELLALDIDRRMVELDKNELE